MELAYSETVRVVREEPCVDVVAFEPYPSEQGITISLGAAVSDTITWTRVDFKVLEVEGARLHNGTWMVQNGRNVTARIEAVWAHNGSRVKTAVLGFVRVNGSELQALSFQEGIAEVEVSGEDAFYNFTFVPLLADDPTDPGGTIVGGLSCQLDVAWTALELRLLHVGGYVASVGDAVAISVGAFWSYNGAPAGEGISVFVNGSLAGSTNESSIATVLVSSNEVGELIFCITGTAEGFNISTEKALVVGPIAWTGLEIEVVEASRTLLNVGEELRLVVEVRWLHNGSGARGALVYYEGFSALTNGSGMAVLALRYNEVCVKEIAVSAAYGRVRNVNEVEIVAAWTGLKVEILEVENDDRSSKIKARVVWAHNGSVIPRCEMVLEELGLVFEQVVECGEVEVDHGLIAGLNHLTVSPMSSVAGISYVAGKGVVPVVHVFLEVYRSEFRGGVLLLTVRAYDADGVGVESLWLTFVSSTGEKTDVVSGINGFAAVKLSNFSMGRFYVTAYGRSLNRSALYDVYAFSGDVILEDVVDCFVSAELPETVVLGEEVRLNLYLECLSSYVGLYNVSYEVLLDGVVPVSSGFLVADVGPAESLLHTTEFAVDVLADGRHTIAVRVYCYEQVVYDHSFEVELVKPSIVVVGRRDLGGEVEFVVLLKGLEAGLPCKNLTVESNGFALFSVLTNATGFASFTLDKSFLESNEVFVCYYVNGRKLACAKLTLEEGGLLNMPSLAVLAAVPVALAFYKLVLKNLMVKIKARRILYSLEGGT